MGIKICLIGCGYMTRQGHGPACKKYAALHHDAELAACCDINREAAEETARSFGFKRTYTDYMQMIHTEKPDVVMVITPPSLTKQVSVDALNAGCHVLLEKPPGLDTEQAMAIHNTALARGLGARVMFNRRYSPLVQKLKEEILAYGRPILNIHYMFIRCERTDADFSTTAIHGVDTAAYIAGSRYKKVEFLYTAADYNGKPVTNTTMMALMENGVTANLTFIPIGGCRMERAVINMADCTVLLELPYDGGFDNPGRLTCIQDNRVVKAVNGTDLTDQDTFFEGNGFYHESASFFDMLRSGQNPGSDVNTGLDAVNITKCMRQNFSAYNKEE